jgi:IS5 family transposase
MVYAMKKKTTGRAADRIRKTIPFPDALAEQIQAIADEKYHGDFTRTVLEELAKKYPAAREFLRTNTTWKHSSKK